MLLPVSSTSSICCFIQFVLFHILLFRCINYNLTMCIDGVLHTNQLTNQQNHTQIRNELWSVANEICVFLVFFFFFLPKPYTFCYKYFFFLHFIFSSMYEMLTTYAEALGMTLQWTLFSRAFNQALHVMCVCVCWIAADRVAQSLCCSHPARHILIIFKFVNPAVQIAAEKSLMRVRMGGSLFFFDCCHASPCGHQSESHLLFNYVKTISFPIHFRSNRIYVAYRTPFVRRSIYKLRYARDGHGFQGWYIIIFHALAAPPTHIPRMTVLRAG